MPVVSTLEARDADETLADIAPLDMDTIITEVMKRLAEIQAEHPDAEVRRGLQEQMGRSGPHAQPTTRSLQHPTPSRHMTRPKSRVPINFTGMDPQRLSTVCTASPATTAPDASAVLV